jgi:hypothetical protein
MQMSFLLKLLGLINGCLWTFLGLCLMLMLATSVVFWYIGEVLLP